MEMPLFGIQLQNQSQCGAHAEAAVARGQQIVRDTDRER